MGVTALRILRPVLVLHKCPPRGRKSDMDTGRRHKQMEAEPGARWPQVQRYLELQTLEEEVTLELWGELGLALTLIWDF